MPRKKKKKAQKPEEKITTPPVPPVLDLTKLEGQLRVRGVVPNGPAAQGAVYYFRVYINGMLARSPWQTVDDGDFIEFYEHNEEDGDVKFTWTVGSEDLMVGHRNCPKPHVDSLFGRGGISMDSLAND